METAQTCGIPLLALTVSTSIASKRSCPIKEVPRMDLGCREGDGDGTDANRAQMRETRHWENCIMSKTQKFQFAVFNRFRSGISNGETVPLYADFLRTLDKDGITVSLKKNPLRNLYTEPSGDSIRKCLSCNMSNMGSAIENRKSNF